MSDIEEGCPPPDGTNYPWAQDLDGIWHKRPAGDPWTPPIPDATVTQANAICSAGPIHSVHCSSFRPNEMRREDDATMCVECVDLDAVIAGARS